jgi:DNA polymerase beta
MNKKIINEFKKLEKQIKFQIKYDLKNKINNIYRSKAISKVLEILENIKFEIKNVDQIINIKNIGKGTQARIDEILKTGKLAEIDEDIINENYHEYIKELENIFGIGEKKAFELFTKYNIKSIAELRQLYEDKKIVLPEMIITGLKYADKIERKIPRKEMDLLNNLLIEKLSKIDKQLFGIICGSYRRLKKTSNDIDFLIVHPKIITKKDLEKSNYLNLFIKKLLKEKYILDSLTGKDSVEKYMGIFRLSNKYPIRRIDIRFLPYESYYYGLLYFTGNAEFNRKMRSLAKTLGYTLNEYGLYDEKGKFISANSEKEIFDNLGMEFVSPKNRII